MTAETSRRINYQYYAELGLSIRGILWDYPDTDVPEYIRLVEDSLSLKDHLVPSADLQDWLESITAAKWLFTNAGIAHAKRSLGLLGIAHCFEGIVYCDYAEHQFPAKPETSAYHRAMHSARVDSSGLCYFVDDSAPNVQAAQAMGWNAAHLDEDLAQAAEWDAQCSAEYPFPRIRSIYELTDVFPELQS